MNFNKELCEERHGNIDKELKRMRERINCIDKKFWAIIVLLFTNLGFLVKALLK